MTTPVDVLYLAWNRLEFTRESFASLLAHTDWRMVGELVVWDDGSTDGTREWLRDAMRQAPVATRFVETQLRSPVEVMAQMACAPGAAVFAKIDNDVLLPPGWLGECLAVMEAHPTLSLLGIEALQPVANTAGRVRSFAPAHSISGLGIYRRDIFMRSLPRANGQWFGFEEWQRRERHRAGWISPALPLVLLDRLPFEPWASLTRGYVARGWQRAWPAYASDCGLWNWRWPHQGGAADRPGQESDFDVVIPSRNASNLIACVRAVLAHEPTLSPAQIVVVDDGALERAEHVLPGVRWVRGVQPFVYGRNVNLGIAASGRDVVVLNDDALLLTPGGFGALRRVARQQANLGLVSAAVNGVVGNANQHQHPGGRLRSESKVLCFIATLIPRRTFEAVGPLDERFTGYGFEDNDYCDRVRMARLDLAVFDGCAVDHSGQLPSTFRTQPGHAERFAHNRALYETLKAQRTPAATSFLGVLRVKNEARHLHEVLKRLLKLCSKAVVLDDHSTDATPDICRSFGERVELLASPFDGLDEARDKNFLLGQVARHAPEWIVWIDGDELLEQDGPEILRRMAGSVARVAAITLKVAYVWDRPDQIRVDGVFGRFRRASMFRYLGQDTSRMVFPSTGGGNLHCGNVPQGLVGAVHHADVRLKHFGYMTQRQRMEKYAWYCRIDPDNEKEDHYRHLAGLPNARFAPGPVQLTEWVE